MADNDPTDVIVTMWHAGETSYVDALRWLRALGVPLDVATRRLAAEEPAARRPPG